MSVLRYSLFATARSCRIPGAQNSLTPPSRVTGSWWKFTRLRWIYKLVMHTLLNIRHMRTHNVACSWSSSGFVTSATAGFNKIATPAALLSSTLQYESSGPWWICCRPHKRAQEDLRRAASLWLLTCVSCTIQAIGLSCTDVLLHASSHENLVLSRNLRAFWVSTRLRPLPCLLP